MPSDASAATPASPSRASDAVRTAPPPTPVNVGPSVNATEKGASVTAAPLTVNVSAAAGAAATRRTTRAATGTRTARRMTPPERGRAARKRPVRSDLVRGLLLGRSVRYVGHVGRLGHGRRVVAPATRLALGGADRGRHLLGLDDRELDRIGAVVRAALGLLDRVDHHGGAGLELRPQDEVG